MPHVEQGLRHAMVDRLITEGSVRGTAVERALRAVPRHCFLPDVRPAAAYSHEQIVTVKDAAGVPLSAVNPPATTAAILEQLGVAPGDRVLEIGTGSGYDAALLAELTGPHGAVSSVELDPVVAGQAGEHLAEAGYRRVEVVHGQGWDGCAARAPFERIIANVGVWDISPAWLEQLDPFGVLVVPLWLRAGLQVSVALRWDLDRLTSAGVRPCGFMRLRGTGAGPETYVTVNDRSVCLDGVGVGTLESLAEALEATPAVAPLGLLRPGWFTGLALAAPDAVQMAWLDADHGYVSAWGVFDAENGGLALVVPGRVGAELHSYGDPAAARRLRELFDAITPVRLTDLRVDVVPVGGPVGAGLDMVAVLRRPNVTVVVRRRPAPHRFS